MITLLFIRHGKTADSETIYGRTDVPLSDEGTSQTEALGQTLYNEGITPNSWYYSPLERVRRTAANVAAPFGVTVEEMIPDERLLEVDFGPQIVGRPVIFFQLVHNDAYTHTIPDLPHAQETREEVAHRVLDVVTEATEGNEDTTFVFLGHGDPLSFAFRKLLHPEEDIPPMQQLLNEGVYLQKGEAVEIQLDENRNVIGFRFFGENRSIHPELQRPPQERK